MNLIIREIKIYVILFAMFMQAVLCSAYASGVNVPQKKNKRIYFGVYAGSAKNETHNADIYDINTTDSTVALGGGARINDKFFVDFRLVPLGSYKTPDDTYKEEFRAITASMLGKLPIGSSGFNIYGSIGYGFITWEYTRNSGIFLVEVKDTGDTITGGLGIQYKIPGAEDLVVSLGYDTYYFKTGSVSGDGEDHSNTINYTSLGVQYWFR